MSDKRVLSANTKQKLREQTAIVEEQLVGMKLRANNSVNKVAWCVLGPVNVDDLWEFHYVNYTDWLYYYTDWLCSTPNDCTRLHLIILD